MIENEEKFVLTEGIALSLKNGDALLAPDVNYEVRETSIHPSRGVRMFLFPKGGENPVVLYLKEDVLKSSQGKKVDLQFLGVRRN